MYHLLAAVAVATALASPREDAPSPVPASAPPPGPISVALRGPEAGLLDPGDSELAAALVAAALESGGRYAITTTDASARWRVSLSVSGRGPWQLRASADASQQGVRTRGAKARSSFSDPDGMIAAADAVAARLHERWAPAGAAAPDAPVPLSRALSESPPAVRAYARALAALRGGDPVEAGARLDEALGADPSFVLAAAQRVWLDQAFAGPFDGPAIASPAAGAALRGAAGSSGSAPERVAAALAALLDGRPGVTLVEGEALRQEPSTLLWGRVTRGLALSALGRRAEALEDWGALGSVAPDPRAFIALGRSRMAAGDFRGASAALRSARTGWPGLLWAYALEAECHARLRDTAEARAVLLQMKAHLEAQGNSPLSEGLLPGLLIGSVDLLEGRFGSALEVFEAQAASLESSGLPGPANDMLYETIVEMRRDLVRSSDSLTRQRQLEDARAALGRFESATSAGDRARPPWLLLKLQGLMMLKEGKTVETWRLIDEIKSRAAEPGYTDYLEAYLSAATLLKEGDLKASAEQFARAAAARGRIVDLMDVAQAQHALRKFDAARAALEGIDAKLQRFDPDGTTGAGELVLADPHLAALVPLYHYARARLAFDTGQPEESRRHFNYMLRYLQQPDEHLVRLVREAYMRGAQPE